MRKTVINRFANCRLVYPTLCTFTLVLYFSTEPNVLPPVLLVVQGHAWHLTKPDEQWAADKQCGCMGSVVQSHVSKDPRKSRRCVNGVLIQKLSPDIWTLEGFAWGAATAQPPSPVGGWCEKRGRGSYFLKKFALPFIVYHRPVNILTREPKYKYNTYYKSQQYPFITYLYISNSEV